MGVEETNLAAAVEAAKATAVPITEIAPVVQTAETVQPAGEANKGKVNAIPYDRFQEVVEQKNSAIGRLENLQAQLDQRTAELGRAVDLIQTKDKDAQLVAEIRRLSENPKWRDTIEKLDKAIHGIEDDVEEGKVTPEAGESKVLKELEKVKAELNDKLADSQTDQLITAADTLCREYMQGLPDVYTADDKRVISRLLTDTIDWDGIEARPTELARFVAAGFQEAIDLNGTPRGLAPAAAQQTANPINEKANSDKILTTLLSAEWGKTREVERGGKSFKEAIVSDADFTKALGAVMRESRGR